jgi:acetyltransferase-like isoleucine patch superfamily enzyme
MNTFPTIRFVGTKKPQLQIGEQTGINGLSIYCWDDRISVIIGKYCSIADEVMIIAGGEHDIDWVTSFPLIDSWQLEHLYSKKKPRWKGHILIGNDVWIGNRATILSGLSIGDGAVVGACSVIVKDVPPYAIVAGNPAKIIRYRFQENQIKAMLSIRWWDWPKDIIKSRAVDFLNIDSFVKKYALPLSNY